MRIFSTISRSIYTNQRLLNASRFYYALRCSSNQTKFNDLPDMPGFTRYQVKTYLATLIEYGWIRQDRKTGKLFVTGQGRISEMFSGHHSCLAYDIPESALTNLNRWREFICGVIVHHIAKHVDFTSTQVSPSSSEPVLLYGQNSAPARGGEELAMSIIQTHMKVSKSEASRMRIAAAKSLLVTNKVNIQPLLRASDRSEIFDTDIDFKELMDKVERGHVIIRQHKAFIQLPNLVHPICGICSRCFFA